MLRSPPPDRTEAGVNGSHSLGLRLTQSVSRTLGLHIKAAAFYSDSTDLLWWIEISGALSQIALEKYKISTEPSQWQHVSTDENPTDVCSRGTSPVELAESGVLTMVKWS